MLAQNSSARPPCPMMLSAVFCASRIDRLYCFRFAVSCKSAASSRPIRPDVTAKAAKQACLTQSGSCDFRERAYIVRAGVLQVRERSRTYCWMTLECVLNRDCWVSVVPF